MQRILEFSNRAINFTQPKEYTKRGPPDTRSVLLISLRIDLVKRESPLSASDHINDNNYINDSEETDQESEELPNRNCCLFDFDNIGERRTNDSRHQSTVRASNDYIFCLYSDERESEGFQYFDEPQEVTYTAKFHSKEKSYEPDHCAQCKRRHPSQHCEILRLLKISELFPDLRVAFEAFDRQPCPVDSLFLLEIL